MLYYLPDDYGSTLFISFSPGHGYLHRSGIFRLPPKSGQPGQQAVPGPDGLFHILAAVGAESHHNQRSPAAVLDPGTAGADPVFGACFLSLHPGFPPGRRASGLQKAIGETPVCSRCGSLGAARNRHFGDSPFIPAGGNVFYLRAEYRDIPVGIYNRKPPGVQDHTDLLRRLPDTYFFQHARLSEAVPGEAGKAPA